MDFLILSLLASISLGPIAAPGPGVANPVPEAPVETQGCQTQQSQEKGDRFPVQQDTHWGYMDRTGQVAIKPQFEQADAFSEGLARVQVGDHYGFINRTGQWVIKPQFDDASHFSAGMAVVKPASDDQYGYINCTGKLVIQPQFVQAAPFSQGLAAVLSPDTQQWGYIDRTGNFVIQPHFSGARPFSQGLAPVNPGNFVFGKWGYIDRTGELVIAARFEEALPFAEGLAAVETAEEAWGYLDRTGNFAIQPMFERALAFSESLAPVERFLGGWIYIDPTGQPAFPSEFEFAEPFTDGLGRVATESDGRSLFHRGGEITITLKNPQWAYLDRQGQQVWPEAKETKAGDLKPAFLAITPGIPAKTQKTIVNQELGFQVRYPANWTIDPIDYPDPFDPEADDSFGFSFSLGGEPPDDWNAVQFSGPGAPAGLMVYAHKAPRQSLAELTEAFQTSGAVALATMFGLKPAIVSTQADITWQGLSGHEMIYSYRVPSRDNREQQLTFKNLILYQGEMRYGIMFAVPSNSTSVPSISELIHLELLP